MKKILLSLASLYLLYMLPACTDGHSAAPTAKEPIISDSLARMITIDTVKQLPVDNQLKLSGMVGFDENKVVKVFPNSSGLVMQAAVSFGDYVHKGQSLAVIKSADVAGNYSDLTSANADLQITKRQMENAKSLYEGGISSQREYEEARENYEKALAETNKIKTTIQINGGGHTAPGGIYTITAPANGYIVEKKVAPGAFIRGDMTDNIFTISDMHDVWIWANVYETDIAKIHEGDPADVTTLAYPDKVFHGRVDKVNNLIDPNNKSLRVRITLPNDSLLLKPEMFADVLIQNQNAKEALAIPASAVVTDNGKDFVVVYRSQNDVTVKPITVIKTTNNISYINGLQLGELVIGQNQLLLYNALAGK